MRRLAGQRTAASTADVDAWFDFARTASDNSAGALYEQLRDPANLDFRPRAGGQWATRSIGAYDAVGDGGAYWIAGRKEWRPSTPVPPDGASSACEINGRNAASVFPPAVDAATIKSALVS